MGGKKALRSIIYKLFPKSYGRYIEVFGGGGWVLFGKPPECKGGKEVYNDYNGNLANLFYCVKNRTLAFLKELGFLPLNSRDEFNVLRRFFEKGEFDTEYLKEELELAQHNLSPPEFAEIQSILLERAEPSDVWRAAAFFKLIRYSYASGLTSFGSQPHDMRSNFSLIEQAHRRLAKVVIENKDFEKLLHQYDRPVSFFYLDPPYHATEGYYQNIGEDGFTEADHIRLRDALMRIEGKFLLSYNDDAFVRGLYDRPGIYLMETTRINNIKQRYDNGAQFPELLIANYDLRERSRAVPSQMTLFDWNGG